MVSRLHLLAAATASVVTLSHAFAPLPVIPTRTYHTTTAKRASTTQPLHFSFFSKDDDAKLEHPLDVGETAGGLLGWMERNGHDNSLSKNKNKKLMIGRDGTNRSKVSLEEQWATLGLGAVALAAVSLALSGHHPDMESLLAPLSNAESTLEHVLQNPTDFLESVVSSVQDMGPAGLLYFGITYTIAEILAIPAVPLTASAGYLFGVTEGTLVVLLAASIAAAVSFVIGRTLLREKVEEWLQDSPQFQKVDKLIGKEGFKLMVLLRLSPIFPFALSNYLYGASSVRFWPYFWGTLLGFTPGTMAYVYTGTVGKALTLGGGDAQPWYIYAGGVALFAGILKLVADVAHNVLEEMEEEEEKRGGAL